MTIIHHPTIFALPATRRCRIRSTDVVLVLHHPALNQRGEAQYDLAEIVANLNRNAESACNVIRHAVREMPAERECKCGRALAHAIVTEPALVPAATRRRLAAIIGKYIS